MADAQESGIRGFINKYPIPIFAAIAVVVLVILYFTIGDLLNQAPPQTPLYFTSDDGQTYFEDDRTNIPPYGSGDNTVRAVVVKDTVDSEPYVLYMVKYKDEVHDQILDAIANDRRVPQEGALYKKPGGEWIDGDDPANLQQVSEIKSLRRDGRTLIQVNPRLD